LQVFGFEGNGTNLCPYASVNQHIIFGDSCQTTGTNAESRIERAGCGERSRLALAVSPAALVFFSSFASQQ
jgi:hypothetical protein